jgi:hypothetical protein
VAGREGGGRVVLALRPRDPAVAVDVAAEVLDAAGTAHSATTSLAFSIVKRYLQLPAASHSVPFVAQGTTMPLAV